jgi:hypothetical protein
MAFSAFSYIINSDWLEEGDELVFTHTTIAVVFWDLSVTNYIAVSEVKELLDTTYSDWSLASVDPVVSLFSNPNQRSQITP